MARLKSTGVALNTHHTVMAMRPRRRLAANAAACGLAAILLASAGTARAGSETTLHNFNGNYENLGDGTTPYGGLINVGGTLYGTTVYGGSGVSGGGAVFSVSKTGAEKVIYSFQGPGPDAYLPETSLINLKGTLYGTSIGGGLLNNGQGAYGTVFAVTTSGDEHVVHVFQGAPTDGNQPQGALLNVGGTLYGTTWAGGANNYGTVYKVTPDGNETVLYSFQGGLDAQNPAGGLVEIGGVLYGTSYYGGANGEGAVFSVTRKGVEKVLYSFSNTYADAQHPLAGLLNVNGTLYGTSDGDGVTGQGAVYSITPSGTETVLHYFGGADGAGPRAGLIEANGTLYGTTHGGGTSGQLNLGTVFSITTSGTFTSLYSFNNTGDGNNPGYGNLVMLGGRLYGTASTGGANPNCNSCGTVFSVKP